MMFYYFIVNELFFYILFFVMKFQQKNQTFFTVWAKIFILLGGQIIVGN